MIQKLIQWKNQPELLNRDTLYELRSILANYPYFQSARILYLHNLYLMHDVSFGEELRKAALFIADRRVLFKFFESRNYMIPTASTDAKEKESDESLDRTLNLIDNFLSHQEEKKDDALKVLVPDSSSDYFASMQLSEDCEEPAPVEEDNTHKTADELIDQFLKQNPDGKLITGGKRSKDNANKQFVGPQNLKTDTDADDPDDLTDESLFTETLAKIYIKQKRYSQALKIIKRLYLNNPKKNAYFADQIRFLEKLIINAKSE